MNVTEATEILGRVSPPLAAALQRRPDLLDGIGDDETVSARVQAALIGAALRDPIKLDGTVADVGYSVGVARYPDDGQDMAAVIRNADRAMYAAKQRGGGIIIYTHAAANEGTGRRDDTSSPPDTDEYDGGPATR